MAALIGIRPTSELEGMPEEALAHFARPVLNFLATR
jgi:hypothetical protein